MKVQIKIKVLIWKTIAASSEKNELLFIVSPINKTQSHNFLHKLFLNFSTLIIFQAKIKTN